MILTDVGEVGVHWAGLDCVLRPSLYAMSRLGSPREIVETYARVMGEPPALQDALAVLYACSEEDISPLFGSISGTRNGKPIYRSGAAEIEHIVPLARCLLKHGITGALPPLASAADEEPEYVEEFDARSHVAVAMAHLRVSELDAWQMTMTALVGALRAKFPKAAAGAPGSRAPSKAEMEATLEWHDRVLAARAKQKG